MPPPQYFIACDLPGNSYIIAISFTIPIQVFTPVQSTISFMIDVLWAYSNKNPKLLKIILSSSKYIESHEIDFSNS